MDLFKHSERINKAFQKDVERQSMGLADGSHEFETEIKIGGVSVVINWQYWKDTTTHAGSYYSPDSNVVTADIELNWCDVDGEQITDLELNRLSNILI